MAETVIKALDNLLTNLGKKDTVELLEFALPRIVERKIALMQLLNANNWEAALQVAHKTLSSVRLYGSNQLEALLQQVCRQDMAVVATPEFQATLESEFSGVITTLKQWLAEHPL